MANFIFLIIILLFVFGCAPAHSPKTLPKDNRMTKEYTQVAAEDLARYEFSHGTCNSFMDQANKAMRLVSRPALEKELGKELSRSEEKKLADIYEKVLREVYPEEEWIEPLSTLYARIFTPEEIKEILAFYQSNSGRRFLKMQSTIMQEAEEMAAIIFKSKEEKFVERLEEEFGAVFSSTAKNLDSTKNYPAAEQRGVNKDPERRKRKGINSERIKDTIQLNISETIQACKAIQESPEKPIECAFQYYEGRPAMAVNFQDYKTAELYWEAMSEKVAGPFCQAAHEANRQAIILVSIQPFDMARLFSCETNEWSKWFNYNNKGL